MVDKTRAERWAVDAAGRPATDAAAPIDAIIPPMAQHKGCAIAVVMDMRPGTASAIAQRSGNARARKLF